LALQQLGVEKPLRWKFYFNKLHWTFFKIILFVLKLWRFHGSYDLVETFINYNIKPTWAS
jgi:hypothetical protein